MQNIARKADKINENESDQPLAEQKRAWDRQENEPILWYGRFQRYLGFGPKRSLQAALADEERTAKVLVSTNVEEKKSVPTKKRTKADKSGPEERKAESNLTPLPSAKVQVPGSWKQASIRYNWVERAKAFDAYFIDLLTQKKMAQWANEPLVTSADRVHALNQLFKATNEMFNKSGQMDFKVKILIRMQSILKDIRDEMSGYNEDFEKAMVEKRETMDYILATQEKAEASLKKMFPSR